MVKSITCSTVTNMDEHIHLIKYITIKETADLLGVTAQTLRAWEKKGILVPYRNQANNYRVYTIRQVEGFLNKMKNDRLKKGRFRLRIEIVEER